MGNACAKRRLRNAPRAVSPSQLTVKIPSTAKPALRFLFVVFDAGESNLLFQTVELLAALGETAGEVAVLALGAPSDAIFAGKPYLHTLASLGIETAVLNGKQDPSRSQKLSAADLRKITARWPCVQCVVAGMAYALQAQVAAAWPDALTVGMVDNWACWSDDSLASRLFVQPGIARHYLVPSPLQCRGLLAAHPHVVASAVGHPALATWRLAAGNVSLVRRITRALYGQRPGVLLAGGYGEGHGETLRTFCQTALLIPDVAFAYAPHPGPGRDGLEMDRALIDELGCTGRVRVTWDADEAESERSGRPLGIDTKLAAAASFATTSLFSTVGGQSLYIGVPHAYIDGPHPVRENIFSAHVPILPTAAELAAWVARVDPESNHVAAVVGFDPNLLSDVLPGLEGSASLRIAHELLTIAADHEDTESDSAVPAVAADQSHPEAAQANADRLLMTPNSPTLKAATPPARLSTRGGSAAAGGRRGRLSMRDELLHAAASPTLSPSTFGSSPSYSKTKSVIGDGDGQARRTTPAVGEASDSEHGSDDSITGRTAA